ncbi:hypothetical protein KM043_009848 [Ampulex compressa]|nr:hypothetical protein KM043_009848 [Ampulex compressa]
MSCFGGRDEQIYIIEILVHKLQLTPGKIKDMGDYPVAVKIKFLDFPVFEITREDFYSVKPPPRDEDGTLHFMIGRSCLFIEQPKELVRELQSTAVKVGVFRVGDTYPTAETEIPLPGCLCDQIAMVANDADNLPKPFVLKGSFHLLDPGENPSGTLEIELRLTCFGRSIMSHYEMHQKFFVFRNGDKEREYCVKRALPFDYQTDESPEDVFLGNGEKKTAEEKIAEPAPVASKLEKEGKKRAGGKKKGRK